MQLPSAAGLSLVVAVAALAPTRGTRAGAVRPGGLPVTLLQVIASLWLIACYSMQVPALRDVLLDAAGGAGPWLLAWAGAPVVGPAPQQGELPLPPGGRGLEQLLRWKALLLTAAALWQRARRCARARGLRRFDWGRAPAERCMRPPCAPPSLGKRVSTHSKTAAPRPADPHAGGSSVSPQRSSPPRPLGTPARCSGPRPPPTGQTTAGGRTLWRQALNGWRPRSNARCCGWAHANALAHARMRMCLVECRARPWLRGGATAPPPKSGLLPACWRQPHYSMPAPPRLPNCVLMHNRTPAAGPAPRHGHRG